jgi:putative endopeptidase
MVELSNCIVQNNLDQYYNRCQQYCTKSNLDILQQDINLKLSSVISKSQNIVPNLYIYYQSINNSINNVNDYFEIKYVFDQINLLSESMSVSMFSKIMASLIQFDIGPIVLRVLPQITNSSNLVLYLQQNTLTLGSVDLYLKKDYKSIRNKYLEFINTFYNKLCFDLNLKKINNFNQKVLLFETILARNHVNESEVEINTKKIKIKDLNLYWIEIFKYLNINFNYDCNCNCDFVYTNNINYLGIINILIKNKNPIIMDYFKCYLMWTFVCDKIGCMHECYQKIYNDFDNVIQNTSDKDNFSLDKSIYSMVNSVMCNQIGYLYIKSIYLPSFDNNYNDTLNAVHHMISNLVNSTIFILKNKTKWLSYKTRKYAIKKIKNIKFHVGFPIQIELNEDKLSDINLTNNAIKNTLKIQKYLFEKNVIRKVNTIRSDYDWNFDWDLELTGLSYHTVNAFYDQSQNSVYIMTAIINKPVFDINQDPALNYGALGAIIGHEIIHAIDIDGCKYDLNGNLCNWLEDNDKKQFELEINKISDHYVSNGQNKSKTIGEDMADIGGLKIALNAYLNLDSNLEQNKSKSKLFFRSWARLWCHKDDEINLSKLSDVHADSSLRINGPLSHIDEFYEIYNVKPQHKMYLEPEKRSKFMS